MICIYIYKCRVYVIMQEIQIVNSMAYGKIPPGFDDVHIEMPILSSRFFQQATVDYRMVVVKPNLDIQSKYDGVL